MESKFTGRLIGLIGISIVIIIVTTITFGIGYPWMCCYKERWIAKHTYIDGKQLVFDGTGGQLIGNYIKWILLTIITLGIYSFWFNIKLKQWVVKHTHHVVTEPTYSTQNNVAEQNSYYSSQENTSQDITTQQ